MQMEETLYSRVRDQFTQYLNEQQLRKTEERYAILELICSYDGHFDCGQLYTDMEKSRFHVSRATVYNTLDILEQARLVVRHQFQQHPHAPFQARDLLPLCLWHLQPVQETTGEGGQTGNVTTAYIHK